MSFPQPSSIAPIIGGKEFWRLKTQLLSAGDLYESEVSALGFAMGIVGARRRQAVSVDELRTGIAVAA